MNVTAVKSDSANISVTAKIEKSDIEKEIDKIAKNLAKTQKIDGFRKGKVPTSIVKRMYKDRLEQEAESGLVGKVIDKAIKDLNINSADIIGEPQFNKFEKRDDKSIDIELIISLKPTIETKDYKKLAPKYEKPTVDDKEVQERLDKLLETNSPFKKVKEDRPLKDGDQALFDFVGKIDGKEFEGGKAENYELVIGSKQFIPGFEEQIVGMKSGETKDINVKFPENYQSKELAGKEATFTVTLHSFKEKTEPKLDDEMIKRLLPGDESASKEKIIENIKKEIEYDKLMELYHKKLKPEFIENLVKNYNFDLPKNIVEQEIDAQLNQKAQNMSEKELEEYRNNPEKLKELRESLREDAVNSVKATFLIDTLAKVENVTVNDNEVSQTIYYEALMSGQDPEQVIKYYQDNNLLPAIKMGMIEDKLFMKILGLNK
jgi:trigger factor